MKKWFNNLKIASKLITGFSFHRCAWRCHRRCRYYKPDHHHGQLSRLLMIAATLGIQYAYMKPGAT